MWFNFGRRKALYAWRWRSVSIEVTALKAWFFAVVGDDFIVSCSMMRERFLEIVPWIWALMCTLGGSWVTWGTLGENFFAVLKAGACNWISSGVGMFVRKMSNEIWWGDWWCLKKLGGDNLRWRLLKVGYCAEKRCTVGGLAFQSKFKVITACGSSLSYSRKGNFGLQDARSAKKWFLEFWTARSATLRLCICGGTSWSGPVF